MKKIKCVVIVFLVGLGIISVWSQFYAEEITKSVNVIYFFPRDGYQNGQVGGEGQSLRNWFYYWKEGNVVSDLSQFEYKNMADYGEYNPNTGKLYVGNAVPASDIYSVTFKNQYYKTFLTSGPDGITNSSAIEDDVQLIPIGKGKPNSTAITAGADGKIDTTTLSGDDTVIGNAITTGPDGIC